MAENIQGNPININIPANVTVTPGKTDLSTFKQQLKEAEKEMGRQLTSLEKSELKSKVINAAVNQRQQLGISLYGNPTSYSMKKFVNEPNPSKVQEMFSSVVKPKGLVGARGGGLDKEIMEREREIAFILKSMKIPLPKGTTGIAAQQQTEVKNMSRIFNKVKKDQAVELDVQKFYQSAANLKALYEKDVAGGGMSKKAYLGRVRELESLSVKFEARAKVSRHDMEPLTAIGKSLVKGPVITATKQLSAVNTAVSKVTKLSLSGAGSPQALANQALADAARDSVLNKANIKKVAKQAKVLQKAVLGATFGGDPTAVSKMFDLQTLAVPNIKKALTNKIVKELRKAGITDLTTGGAGDGGGNIPKPPTGGMGGAFGGFKASAASAGAFLLNILKDKIVQFAGFAAGALGKAITLPLTTAFNQVGISVKDALKEGPEMVADMVRMATPLALKTGDWKKSMEGVQSVFAKVMGDSIILPNEIAKIAFSYTRVTKETKGLVGYLKEVSLLHAYTQESLQTIDDMVLEWAQAFDIDIPRGAAKIASAMTTISAMTDVSIMEMRQISAWLTPIFAQQRDAEKALREEMALSGLLAQRGSKLPIMVRSMQGAISQLQTPSNSMLGLFASMNLNIYKMKDGTTGWANTYKSAGAQLKALYDEQNRLNKAAAGGAGGPEWISASKDVNDRIKQQEGYLAEMFGTWQDGGLIVDDTLEALGELAKLMDNPGTQARFLKELKGSSRDAFFQLLRTVGEAKKLAEFTKTTGGDVNAIIKAQLEKTSIYQAQRATAGKKLLFNTLEAQLFEPLRVPFFKAFADLFDQWNKSPKFTMALKGMGKVMGAIGEQYITPAIQDLGTLIESVFTGGPDAKTNAAAASERLKLLVTGFLGRIATIVGPIITPVGELIGNLFMLGFMSVLNSDFIKQIGGILVGAGKQLIVGLYEQAGTMGKALIGNLFPFAAKKDDFERRIGVMSWNSGLESRKTMWRNYSTNKDKFYEQYPVTDKLFSEMEALGYTINNESGEIELINTALTQMQEGLRNSTLSLNNLSMSALTAKNNLEARANETPAQEQLRKVKESLGAVDTTKLEFGSTDWHLKYRASMEELQSTLKEYTKLIEQGTMAQVETYRRSIAIIKERLANTGANSAAAL